jgi:metallo-beta-lactamase family protein
MKLTFWGAAQTVTGSMHELEINGRNYLLDCGLYQGQRKNAFERNSHLPWPGSAIDAVVLSHAHIDHSGNLPSLGGKDFEGPIHATPATIDLCGKMLPDSAFIQVKDSEFFNKRMARRKRLRDDTVTRDATPLYTPEDAEKVLRQFSPVNYHEPKQIGDGFDVELYDAGHLLGSAALRMNLKDGGKTVRLIFSGDVGRKNLPIIRDPEPLPEADYLIMESTYGNKLHKADELVVDKLADTINRTMSRGGRIIVPAFAVGRTQQVVLLIHQLLEAKRIAPLPIYVDSPLAVNATEVYRAHGECYDAETAAYLSSGTDPFGFSLLRYVRDVSESKGLNDLRGPMMIISASGMCEAGRVLHHLRNNIGDSKNTVLIVGFQAENTLGRKILDGVEEVPIFGDLVRVRAEVVRINELSGHADQGELLTWMKPIAKSLKGVFLVHGELDQSNGLAAAIRERYQLDVHIPARGESVELR